MTELRHVAFVEATDEQKRQIAERFAGWLLITDNQETQNEICREGIRQLSDEELLVWWCWIAFTSYKVLPAPVAEFDMCPYYAMEPELVKRGIYPPRPGD